jgi:hypothetical protein
MLTAAQGPLKVVKYLVQEAGANKDKEGKVTVKLPQLRDNFCYRTSRYHADICMCGY